MPSCRRAHGLPAAICARQPHLLTSCNEFTASKRDEAMAEQKILAGHAVRRLRRQVGVTQAAMAEMQAISPSYLNLVERNQRPVSATLLVRLAERFDFDPHSLAANKPKNSAAAI